LQPGQPGSPSLPFDLPPNGSRRIYLEGAGSARQTLVQLSAPGFQTLGQDLGVSEPQFFFTPGASGRLEARLDARTTSVPVSVGAPGQNAPDRVLGAGAGTVRVEFTSSDPKVFEPASASLDFTPGEGTKPLTLNLKSAGDAILTLRAPAGFNPPSGTASILVTVR
jgi:hypothetical protein